MKKRSAYRPKPVNPNPLNRVAKAPKHKRDRLMLTFLASLDAMARGVDATPAEWRNLSDVINTIETLALTMHKANPHEVMPTVNAAIEAMRRATQLHKAGECMRLDAAGIDAMLDLISIYDQCMEELTEYEMTEAQRLTQKRVNELRRSPDHQVICL